MITVTYAPSFIKLYKRLEEDLKDEVLEKVDLFKDAKNHKNLKVHKLKNIENTYAFSVNYKIRIIFEYQDKKNVDFLLIGSHDQVY